MLTALWIMTTAHAVPPADAEWSVAQRSPVRVECTTVGRAPWCRAEALLGVEPSKVQATLEDFAGHRSVFHSVSSLRELQPGLIHVVLDYPAPLTDRDYVAQYTRVEDGAAVVYRWTPVEHPGAPVHPERIRMVDMAGEWRVEAADGGARVTYIWQADIRGDVPNWILTRARKVTGNTILVELSKSLGTKAVAR